MKTTHTPGPWEIVVVNHNGWTLDGSDRPFMPLYRIGDGEFFIEPKEALANARLIAAAPELLEALVGIISAVEDPAYDKEVRREVMFQRAIAAKAVVKAACGE